MRIIAEKDPLGGEFIYAVCDAPTSRLDALFDAPFGVDAFVCSYLDEPYFMSATAGRRIADLPKETQWLAVKHRGGGYTVWLSIAAVPVRTSFYGAKDGLHAVALTGDTQTRTDVFPLAYRVKGRDLYALVHTAARAIVASFGTVTLREDKASPDFMRYFGWCTWDSFYEGVTAADVRAGLESFRLGGLVPKLLILDDGWQSTDENHLARGEWKLSSFRPNGKFDGNLTPTVRLAKDTYGVKHFFVWHAVLGYWGGVSTSSPEMRAFAPHLSVATHTEEMKELNPERWETEHFPFGLIAPDAFFSFYDGYHSGLAAQGVDGVKIDVQASLTGHGEKNGGRVSLVRRMREGLEASVCKHFGGQVINCMSTANDILYHTARTAVMRSSDDFFPNDPASHARHIYHNAVNSIYMGEFTLCDWDMFQTAHPYGRYHAAARAISGGPIYVSDRVDEHDFAVIHALTDDEGKILPPLDIARPTPDCLFDSPMASFAPLKIFNRNRFGYVLGLFAKDTAAPVKATCAPADIPAAVDEKYAAYSHKSGRAYLAARQEASVITLASGEFDIVTYAPIKDGIAVIGLADKYNAGGAVAAVTRETEGYTVTLTASGTLCLYTERTVTRLLGENGEEIPFTLTDGFLFARVPAGTLTAL